MLWGDQFIPSLKHKGCGNNAIQFCLNQMKVTSPVDECRADRKWNIKLTSFLVSSTEFGMSMMSHDPILSHVIGSACTLGGVVGLTVPSLLVLVAQSSWFWLVVGGGDTWFWSRGCVTSLPVALVGSIGCTRVLPNPSDPMSWNDKDRDID